MQVVAGGVAVQVCPPFAEVVRSTNVTTKPVSALPPSNAGAFQVAVIEEDPATALPTGTVGAIGTV